MGLQRFYLVARTGILFTLVRAAMILLALSAGYGIVALALIHFLLSMAMSVIIFRFALRELPYLAPRLVRPERHQVAKIVAFSKYVFVTNVGEKVGYLTDWLVIGAFLPISTLTFYAIPASLVTYLKSFIGAMGVVVNPMSSSLEAASDDSRLRLLFLTASKAAVVLGLPVCVGFVVLGERFIDIWMGSGFGTTSGPVLIVLAITHFIGLPHHTISGVLYGLGRHRITAVTRVCEAAANLALSVILVQQYGLIGVALGTLIPHAVALGLVLPAATGRVLSVPLRTYYASTYVRPLAASIPFILTCGLIDRVLRPTTLATFLAAVCVGLTTYVVPCWVIALSEDERRSARQRLGRLAWR
jgi:O-antigen/teichoic acid export membrane protein